MPAKNAHQSETNMQRFVTLSELTGDQIALAARADGEPEWLIEQRIQAWDFFAQTPPPEWRRTNLTRLQPEQITPWIGPQGTVLHTDASQIPEGVVFKPLKYALQSHEALIHDRLARLINPLRHKFSALRMALWQDGTFLYVPRNVSVELPLHVSYTLPHGSRSLFPYSLVVLEQGAQVTFIEEFISHNVTETVLAGPTTEIFAGQASQIRFISVQRWGTGVFHLGSQMLLLDRDAQSEWVSVALGGEVQHIEAETRLQGDGSTVNWRGATFASGNQQLLTAPWLRHMGVSNESHMDFRTVVAGKGYSVFDGMIKIERESRGTITRLEEHAVHLTPEARSDSIPGLKIDTNDVASAGHASTSGQIDDEQLFYMQTRGIKRDDAVRMIVMGLFEPALTAIPVEAVRTALTAAIEAKI